jgi:hypothetical protein
MCTKTKYKPVKLKGEKSSSVSESNILYLRIVSKTERIIDETIVAL